MGLFKKKTEKKSYDPDRQKPVIHCSICNGEQVAGFKDKETGHFEEVMLIRNDSDLQQFRDEYSISGDIEKEY
jgi:hypothetical protein